uniref:Uncharacterized protein n=1 Tax=Candidatus Kentrum sp. LPFa TaxID=2126335 RepID=A0A450XYR1_9GAMM|nr:MAG: hypothetical protein BECKLPF1236C_GA0070990_102691 [Candidatus Kentron sp. LPFa]
MKRVPITLENETTTPVGRVELRVTRQKCIKGPKRSLARGFARCHSTFEPCAFGIIIDERDRRTKSNDTKGQSNGNGKVFSNLKMILK